MKSVEIVTISFFSRLDFMTAYIGRFAPSPTGSLHAGSLVAALASWLDARAHGGKWLVRMEDVDQPRCIQGMDDVILNQLASFGMVSDAPVVYQSRRTSLYEAALKRLQAKGLVYRCYCSRKSIGLGIYSGTCRTAIWNKPSQATYPVGQYAYRLRANGQLTTWTDRRLGAQSQNVALEVGDFVIKRSDGLFAYQLAVVVDDLDQGITHIVRGEDLADNTARQIILKNELLKPVRPEPAEGLPPTKQESWKYFHVPLVLAEDGQKLSKQNGAKALDTVQPMQALNLAASRLGLGGQRGAVSEALAAWTREWTDLYNCLP
jgi:glutamyl-Q tRNA(Asp) synthetase